jgi:thiamine-phosphate pyrophosphorylase
VTALLGLATRLRLARLYLCTDTRRRQGDLADFLTEAFHGGVDIVQIREKNLSAEDELAALETARAAAQPFQAIVCVNDQPKLAGRFQADMLHVGQDDGSSRRAKRHLHQWALVGRSTHSTRQVDETLRDEQADYFCVGPVYATPTKPDYPPVGLELVRYAAQVAPVADPASRPWFAIGGINPDNLEDVLAAGGRRVCVVRAITEASDPRAAAERLAEPLRQAWQDDPRMEAYTFAAFNAR